MKLGFSANSQERTKLQDGKKRALHFSKEQTIVHKHNKKEGKTTSKQFGSLKTYGKRSAS